MSSSVIAQGYDHVDNKVKEYPNYDQIEHLAHRIQNDFDSDMDRVRAAFVWVAYNITYGKTLDEFFKPRETIIFYSERGKDRQLEKVEEKRIRYAFKNKRGLCIDYSKILKKLCDNLNMESHIVRGVAKEDIKDITGEKVYKNHAWNVFKLNGEWKLMDPTWASGYYDEDREIHVKKFDGYYFDVSPEEFIKDHFPVESKWQLLDEPIALNTFYTAPIFLPGYFENKVVLSNDTSGLLSQSENYELVFAFEKFPRSNRLKYSIDTNRSKGKIYNLDVRRKGEQLYVSKVKLKSTLKDGQKLTLYIDKEPILKFRISQ
ncbi:transglutaminase domain-containing protein [Flagellimonas sp. 2504JD4-2]